MKIAYALGLAIAAGGGFLLAWLLCASRFTLFNATFEQFAIVDGAGVEATNRYLVKLDTRTGRVWKWTETVVGTNSFYNWIELGQSINGRGAQEFSHPSE